MTERGRRFLTMTLLVASGCSPRAERVPASANAARILTALPSASESFAEPPGDNVLGQGWAALLEVAKPRSAAEVDSVAAVLQAQENLVPANIEEALNDRADGRVAVATCRGHVPIIYYSPSEIARFDPRTTSFVRQHELAHHRLGHVDCSGPQPLFPGYDEKSADCAAVNALRPNGLRGRDVVMSIASIFYYLNKPSATPYPSTRERAAYLEAGCGTALPSG